ncbi:MAG TPA: hypothetical protein VF290_21415 [Pyrinomonadaceae bacterium]
MKTHILRGAVGILTFVIGWSISTVNFNSSCGRAVQRSKAPSAWDLLLSVQNRDLSKIEGEPRAQLETAIESLRGKVETSFLQPRLFSKVSTNNGEQKYVLVEMAPLLIIPGNSHLRINVFNPEGNLINSSEFRSGWRIDLGEIRFIHVQGIRGEVLEVESYPVINGADIARQYYALVGDKMRLIRLEDSAQALTPNTYRLPNYTIGVTEVGQSAAVWQEALLSNDVVEALAALTWLGGEHCDVNDREPAHWHEDVSEARLVDEVRRRPAVKAAVKALQNSDNPWVRDAAISAAEMMP